MDAHDFKSLNYTQSKKNKIFAVAAILFSFLFSFNSNDHMIKHR